MDNKDFLHFIFSRDEVELPKTIDNYDGTKKLIPQWCKVSDLYTK